jgi:8-oxo-dGTP diphosphatase
VPATDQGARSVDRYQIIPRTLIFVTCRDQLLLIKGAPHKRLWANLYNGIGGHIERGESIAESACRELNEETGIQLTELRLVGIVTVDTGENPGVGLFLLSGELPSTIDRTGWRAQYDEGTLEWVPIDQVSGLPLVSDLPELLPRVLNSKPGDAPFIAQSFYDDHDNLQVRFT